MDVKSIKELEGVKARVEEDAVGAEFMVFSDFLPEVLSTFLLTKE